MRYDGLQSKDGDFTLKCRNSRLRRLRRLRLCRTTPLPTATWVGVSCLPMCSDRDAQSTGATRVGVSAHLLGSGCALRRDMLFASQSHPYVDLTHFAGDRSAQSASHYTLTKLRIFLLVRRTSPSPQQQRVTTQAYSQTRFDTSSQLTAHIRHTGHCSLHHTATSVLLSCCAARATIGC